MNTVRSVISIFLVVLLAVSIAGWMWAGGQPSPKLEGARVALGLCGLMSIGSLIVLWKAKNPQTA